MTIPTLALPYSEEYFLRQRDVLNAYLLNRGIEVLGWRWDAASGGNLRVRFRVPSTVTHCQVHVQNTATGGLSYNSATFVSSVEVDCRASRTQDVTVALASPNERYVVFLVPVQYDAVGTKVLYDGEGGRPDNISFVGEVRQLPINASMVQPGTFPAGNFTFQGHVLFAPDNTYSIGAASGVSRPASIFLGTSLVFRPGARDYTITVDDPSGAIKFLRSDVPSNGLNLNVNVSDVAWSPVLSTAALRFAAVAGSIVFTPTEGGGAGIIDFGRRLSDSSTAVGAQVRFWTITGQATPAWEVLAPGGASNVAQMSASGALTITGLIQTTVTTEQARLRYDASNYLSVTVSSAGAVTYDAVGASAKHLFSDDVDVASTKVYRVNATQVMTARQTGYTNAMTGTANRATAYDTATITLVQLAERVKAVTDDLFIHGLLGV